MYLFSSTLIISIHFPFIYGLIFFTFRATICFTEPDCRLIRMTSPNYRGFIIYILNNHSWTADNGRSCSLSLGLACCKPSPEEARFEGIRGIPEWSERWEVDMRFRTESLKSGDHLEDLVIDGRVMLKFIWRAAINTVMCT